MAKLQLLQLCCILMIASVMGSIINDFVEQASVRAKKTSPKKQFCHHTHLFQTAYEELVHSFKDLVGDLCLTEVTSDVDTNYYYVSKPEETCNWSGACDFCRAHGMSLARFDTIPDLFALLAAVEEQFEGPDDFFWIGLNDQANEGVFEWTSPLGNKTSDAWLKTWGWFEGEPTSNIYNSDGKEQNCVNLMKQDKCVRFTDCDCYNTGRFICIANPVRRALLNFQCGPK